jgi:hypothetical protein
MLECGDVLCAVFAFAANSLQFFIRIFFYFVLILLLKLEIRMEFYHDDYYCDTTTIKLAFFVGIEYYYLFLLLLLFIVFVKLFEAKFY